MTIYFFSPYILILRGQNHVQFFDLSTPKASNCDLTTRAYFTRNFFQNLSPFKSKYLTTFTEAITLWGMLTILPNPKLLLQQLQVCGRHYNCQLSTTLLPTPYSRLPMCSFCTDQQKKIN